MGNLSNLGPNMSGANAQLNKLPQVPPNYVPPVGGNGFGQPGGPGGANPPTGSSQPSTAQLRMLVQQIQMAVQAGYLNHQILNQPLAPQTLILLNQLLSCIKVRFFSIPCNFASNSDNSVARRCNSVSETCNFLVYSHCNNSNQTVDHKVSMLYRQMF